MEESPKSAQTAPEWVSETQDLRYALEAFDIRGDAFEDHELDRFEFLMLKRCLAIFRGHVKDKYIHAGSLERLSQVEPDDEQESDAAVDIYHVRALETCRKILAADTGCNSPFEAFFGGLVMLHGARAITPDDVEKELEEFRDNWEMTVEATRNMVQQYPAIFS